MADDGLGTTAIVQIGLVVQDIDASARAWAALFGLPVPEIKTSPSVEVAHTLYDGQSTSARVRQTFFRMGAVTVELMEPLGEPSTWNDQLAQHGNSLHNITVRVTGLPDKLAYVAAQGLPLVQRGEFPGGRSAYVDGTATLGAVLQLVEID
jgi:hypothetical protein